MDSAQYYILTMFLELMIICTGVRVRREYTGETSWKTREKGVNCINVQSSHVSRRPSGPNSEKLYEGYTVHVQLKVNAHTAI